MNRAPFIVIVLLLLSFNLYAAKKIIIKDASCSALMEQAEAVLAWSHKLGEHLDAELPQCKVSGSEYSIDLHSISPNNVQTYQNVFPKISGPNCWNRALVFANILPKLSYTTPEEMTFWMESALCQERRIDEEVQPGDIIAIRKGYSEEIHGFTYLTDDLAFSKNGYSKYSNYAYESLDSVFGVYGVPTECRRVTSYTALSNVCRYRGWATYYNCRSLDQYLDDVGFQPDYEAQEVSTKLNQLDHDVFKHLFKGLTTQAISKGDLAYRLKKLKERIQRKIKDNLSEDEELYWRGMMQRVYALEVQISLMRDYSRKSLPYGFPYA